MVRAAIKAGIQILLKEMNLESTMLDGVFLNGAFGNSLDLDSVMGIGLLSDTRSEKVKRVSNAAGLGAVLSLISAENPQEIEGVVKQVQHIELSRHPDFSRCFTR